MFDSDLLDHARRVIDANRAAGLTVVTAESCTGGLVAGVLTEIAGSSDVVDRGFVTYSNEAKMESLGVHRDLIDAFGAVSVAVAWAMAQGALKHSRADTAVAITASPDPAAAHPRNPSARSSSPSPAAATPSARSPTPRRSATSVAARSGVRRSCVRSNSLCHKAWR